jgi:hypothetical protein
MCKENQQTFGGTFIFSECDNMTSCTSDDDFDGGVCMRLGCTGVAQNAGGCRATAGDSRSPGGHAGCGGTGQEGNSPGQYEL